LGRFSNSTLPVGGEKKERALLSNLRRGKELRLYSYSLKGKREFLFKGEEKRGEKKIISEKKKRKDFLNILSSKKKGAAGKGGGKSS